MNAVRLRLSILRKSTFAVMSTWRGMVSARVSIVTLNTRCRNCTGGEFVLSEQRPRMQSRVEVVPLQQGDAVAFAVHNRPVKGTKGTYRVNLRNGVSRVRTVGIIFHDAK